MKHVSFSRHLAVVYTLIIAIPLMILMLVASEYLRTSLYDSASSDAVKAVKDNAALVRSFFERIERLESIVTSDYDLLRTYYYAEETDAKSTIEDIRSDSRYLERLLFAIPDIYSFHLFFRNPNVPERWPTIFSESRRDFSRFERWTFNYRDATMVSLTQTQNPSVCLTREVLMSTRHVGYLQISMKMTDFFPFLYSKKDKWSGDYVFYRNESLVPTDGSERLILSRVLAEPSDRLSGRFEISAGGSQRIVAYERIPRLDMIIVHATSAEAIISNVAIVRFASIGILLASIAVLFAVIAFATRKLFARLFMVVDAMEMVRSGRLDVAISVGGNDEVAQMSEVFTSMVRRIESLIGEIKQEQELVTQTEIKAMQNQINAHFLYNVLETIKMQAELRDEREIAESLTILGRLLRYSLRWRDHRVRLWQEIEYAEDYVSLMNIRNDYAIALSVDIADDLLETGISKMLIQPVVENAVLHGIAPLGEDGRIELSARIDESGMILKISVRDYGQGMSQGQLESLLEGLSAVSEPGAPVGGIGLRNIEQRLRAFYGPEFSLSIRSEPGKGTEVTIPVPMERREC